MGLRACSEVVEAFRTANDASLILIRDISGRDGVTLAIPAQA